VNISNIWNIFNSTHYRTNRAHNPVKITLYDGTAGLRASIVKTISIHERGTVKKKEHYLDFEFRFGTSIIIIIFFLYSFPEQTRKLNAFHVYQLTAVITVGSVFFSL